ncbi:hypothetical protein VSDG_09301 [Cytospora chrysosperma]|uniref:Uncharacterized protein n=1 Tax=Cytospora chrysosperma TaxID=252740 RepID=A0A423VBB3_CYTCH|nr:hypothetical protein VSDG_09301 [Valsa sordida]
MPTLPPSLKPEERIKFKAYKAKVRAANEEAKNKRGKKAKAKVEAPDKLPNLSIKLTFFDPISIFKNLIASDIFRNAHQGPAYFVDEPTELFHNDNPNTGELHISRIFGFGIEKRESSPTFGLRSLTLQIQEALHPNNRALGKTTTALAPDELVLNSTPTIVYKSSAFDFIDIYIDKLFSETHEDPALSRAPRISRASKPKQPHKKLFKTIVYGTNYTNIEKVILMKKYPDLFDQVLARTDRSAIKDDLRLDDFVIDITDSADEQHRYPTAINAIPTTEYRAIRHQVNAGQQLPIFPSGSNAEPEFRRHVRLAFKKDYSKLP